VALVVVVRLTLASHRARFDVESRGGCSTDRDEIPFGPCRAFPRVMDVILTKQVPVVQRDTNMMGTLPTGSVVEISDSPRSFFVEVDYKGHRYSLFRDDLLEACTWEDMERIGLD
jgi:hypothetical protein